MKKVEKILIGVAVGSAVGAAICLGLKKRGAR